MVSTISLVKFLLVINFFIQPATCPLPTYFEDIDIPEISSIRPNFKSLTNKFRIIANQIRCPNGWSHFDGSCYHLSNIRSISTQANDTCSLLHSNRSNLMQIDKPIEFFYAAHILTKNNLSSLILEIDKNLLKEKRKIEVLMNDQNEWKRQKDQIHEEHIEYNQFQEKVLDRLHSISLRIRKRWKIIDDILLKYDENPLDYNERTLINYIFRNNTKMIDDFNFINQTNDFQQIDNLQEICQQIDWNITNTSSTIYLLKRFPISNKTVCSLTHVKTDVKYEPMCEYVLSHCFEKNDCGKYGRCVLTLAGFKCLCFYFHHGSRCEKLTNQGKQILVCLVLICILTPWNIKITRRILIYLLEKLLIFCKLHRKKNKTTNENSIEHGTRLEMLSKKNTNGNNKIVEEITMHQHISLIDRIRPVSNLPIYIKLLKYPTRFQISSFSILCCWITLFTCRIVIFLISFMMLRIFYFPRLEKYVKYNQTSLNLSNNDHNSSITNCQSISNYRMNSILVMLAAFIVIFLFSFSIKRQKFLLNVCKGRPGLIPPIYPFHMTNRFTSAIVFGIIVFELLDIFERFIYRITSPSNHGILIESLDSFFLVFLVGIRHYLILIILQVQHFLTRALSLVYVVIDFLVGIQVKGICVGFSPLSGNYLVTIEEKLRKHDSNVNTYLLIKFLPDLFFRTCLMAVLINRATIDSLCTAIVEDIEPMLIRQRLLVWCPSIPIFDDWLWTKSYLAKFFRESPLIKRRLYPRFRKTQQLSNKSIKKIIQLFRHKFLHWIYPWKKTFRFTTLATCIYTAAFTFLYYLTCTIIILYLSKLTDLTSILKYYIETVFNIEFKKFFSLKSTIIISAIITSTLYAFQLYIGMQKYEKHKLELYKGICKNIPPVSKFEANPKALESIHYAGYLIGYLAWSFLICFHTIFILIIVFQIIRLKPYYLDKIIEILMPIIVIYLLKLSLTLAIGNIVYAKSIGEKLRLKNPKVYTIFVYFTFFADCFIGIFECIFHTIKTTVLNIIYMTRLDSNFLGRSIEKYDSRFISYASYLHMEVTHTHPIMLGFCYSLYLSIVRRRSEDSCEDTSVVNQYAGVLHARFEQEESHKRDKRKEQILQASPQVTANVSIAHTTVNNLVHKPKVKIQSNNLTCEKRARTRWFLIYTLQNNPQLCVFRKSKLQSTILC